MKLILPLIVMFIIIGCSQIKLSFRVMLGMAAMIVSVSLYFLFTTSL